MSYIGAQDRALQDTLRAERSMRDRSEKTIRALVKLLAELANRYDGERLEELRRADPNDLAMWNASDWRKFFASIPLKTTTATKGWGGQEAHDKDVTALMVKIKELEDVIARLPSTKEAFPNIKLDEKEDTLRKIKKNLNLYQLRQNCKQPPISKYEEKRSVSLKREVPK